MGSTGCPRQQLRSRLEVFLMKPLPKPADRVNDRGVVAAVMTAGDNLVEVLSCLVGRGVFESSSGPFRMQVR